MTDHRTMTALADLEILLGGFLLFFLPGYALTRALFPEWRIRGPDALRRSVETVTLSFVLSVVLTVIVGYGLLAAAPGGFQASWTDPSLEVALLGIAVVSLGGAALRGAFRRVPPPPLTAPAGDEGAWELTRALEQLTREERRIRHALRTMGSGSGEERELRSRLATLEAERANLQRRREGEFAEQ